MSEDTRQKRITRSVDALQRLYAVAIGLALTEGIRRVVDPLLATSAAATGSVGAVGLSTKVMLYAVLVATVVPFYHGATRHLDDLFIFSGDRTMSGAIIADFIFLFFEAILFVAMGMFVLNPPNFFGTLFALLVVDIVWSVVSWLYTGHNSKRHMPLTKWAITNVAFALVLFWALFTPWGVVADRQLQFATALALVRTALDYRWNWSFYTGTDPAGEPSSASVT